MSATPTSGGPPVVIVSGAAGGIGSTLVATFEGAGWRVVSTDRNSIPRRDDVPGDLSRCTDPEDAEFRRLVATLRAAAGPGLKAIVHNAAHQVVRDSASLTAADWNATLAVNLLAPFWLTMAFREELQTNRGSMLVISSIHGKLTKPGFVAYATSKAAVSGLVRSMAVDLSGSIRCNAICPAAIATPMLLAGFSEHPDALAQLERHHPSGRIGSSADVANAAVFVCSDKAGFMNGSLVDLSGGISSRLHDPV